MYDEFSWASALGIGVTLFLVGGGVHVLIGLLSAILIDSPLSGHYLFLSARTDAALYGTNTEELLKDLPALRQLKLTLLYVVSGLLLGLGVMEIGTAWFGLRGGEPWALAVLAIAGLAMLPMWYVVLRPYLASGPVGLSDVPPFIWIPTLALLPAIVLSWLGL